MAPLPPAIPPGATPVSVPADSTLWDRLTNWASENKAVVYTIAGVVVVVSGAGAVYYLSNSVRASSATVVPGFRPVPCNVQVIARRLYFY